MSTVVRYSLMRSFSTVALIETTCAPWIPRSVFAASWTAASAAFANESGVLLAPDLNGILNRAMQLYAQVGDAAATQLTQTKGIPTPTATPAPSPRP